MNAFKRLLVRMRNGDGVPHRLYWQVYNIWPALRGTGGRVTHVSEDWTELDVKLPLNWRTRNYFGTIFGGSLYSSTDPYVMLMLVRQLGPEYIVWDKGARISFKRPGTTTLYAKFRVPAELAAELKAKVDAENKTEYTYSLDLKDAEGKVYATIDKVVFIARKDWFKAREARRAQRPGVES
jgi:acyl-coenzyme A thioesterase PaaI-like protein